jgi:hypothetical protein
MNLGNRLASKLKQVAGTTQVVIDYKKREHGKNIIILME